MTRHFITIESTSNKDLASIYQLATAPFDNQTLQGQGVALVFERRVCELARQVLRRCTN